MSTFHLSLREILNVAISLIVLILTKKAYLYLFPLMAPAALTMHQARPGMLVTHQLTDLHRLGDAEPTRMPVLQVAQLDAQRGRGTCFRLHSSECRRQPVNW